MAGGIEQTSGDIQTLQRLADEAKTLLRNNPLTERVSDDWGDAALTVDLEVEPDSANLAVLDLKIIKWLQREQPRDLSRI